MANARNNKKVKRKFNNWKRYKNQPLNICKSQIILCVNDSQCVIVKLQESISIRDGIIVKVIKIDKAQLKLGIDAPADVTINRQEVYKKDQIGNVLSSTSGVYPNPHHCVS